MIDTNEFEGFFVNQIIEWAKNNYRFFPWRGEDISIYQSLIAELLLRRTTAKQVENIYESFMDAYPNPDVLNKASITELESILKPLGLKSQRAAALKDIASTLVQQGTPTSIDEIKMIPHIGTYICNAIGCFSLGLRLPIIDSNVIRIFSSFFGISSILDNRRNKDIQILADKIIPQNEYVIYNYGLLDFGAIVCTRKPRCNVCALKQFCRYLICED